jgi:hypothetical protein
MGGGLLLVETITQESANAQTVVLSMILGLTTAQTAVQRWMVMGMRKDISKAASIVCPMCDEKKCVGRYNCKQISDYLKTKLVDIDQFRKSPAVYSVDLPVKLGQKVYTIPRSAIREWTVVGVWISVKEEYSYVHISYSKSGRILESRGVNFHDIDKTLYLTREEAESALEMIKGDAND